MTEEPPESNCTPIPSTDPDSLSELPEPFDLTAAELNEHLTNIEIAESELIASVEPRCLASIAASLAARYPQLSYDGLIYEAEQLLFAAEKAAETRFHRGNRSRKFLSIRNIEAGQLAIEKWNYVDSSRSLTTILRDELKLVRERQLEFLTFALDPNWNFLLPGGQAIPDQKRLEAMLDEPPPPDDPTFRVECLERLRKLQKKVRSLKRIKNLKPSAPS